MNARKKSEPKLVATETDVPEDDGGRGQRLIITPIGGLEEVGKNLTLLEYKNEILVIDAGLKFAGPKEPGIDYLVNDIGYLIKNQHRVCGIVITHAHLDHIGGLPQLLRHVPKTVYCTPFCRAMIAKSVEERAPEVKLKTKEIKADKVFQVGPFSIDPVHVNHSIIQCLSLAITTPVGVIFHSGDFRIDYKPFYEPTTDLNRIAEYGKNGVLAYLGDSTNSINEGHSRSEADLALAFEKILKEAEGRVIVATFSSQIYRVMKIMELCKALGRRIYLTGRSMIGNIEIGVGLQVFKDLEQVLITEHEAKKLPKNKVVVITTGSQGEETAGLSLISQDKHKVIRLDKDDTIVFSSSVIPGNEGSVNTLINRLTKKGIRIITNRDAKVHASGHGYQEELKILLELIKPKYFIPVHGESMHLAKHKQLAVETGVLPTNCLIAENGQRIELSKKGVRFLEKMPLEPVYIENDFDNEANDETLADRSALMESGMVVYSIRGNEDGIAEMEIVNKGFLNRTAREHVFMDSRKLVARIVEQNPVDVFKDRKKVEVLIKKELKKYFQEQTGKVPVIVVFVLFTVRALR